MTKGSISSSGDAASLPGDDVAPTFDHHDPNKVNERHAIYDHLLSKCPVAHSERQGGFWVITGHPEIERIARDTTSFSNRYTSVPKAYFKDNEIHPPINLDPPEHTVFRRLLLPEFTAAKAALQEPLLRSHCVSVLDRVAGQTEFDASSAYSRSIPVHATCRLLGLPPEDEETFVGWIHTLVEVGANEPKQAAQAAKDMTTYLEHQVEAHRQEERDDLIALLVNAEIDGAPISHDLLIGCLILMVFGGIDTTWSALNSALWHLGTHPEDRDRLVAAPELIPTAIEELLRFYAPAVLGRVVTRDTEFDGAQMKEGDSILLCYPAANRDPRAFEEPERVVIDRVNNRHFTFGASVHRCIGSSLARLELRVGIEEWLRRYPLFELVDANDLELSTGPIWGPRKLRVNVGQHAVEPVATA